MNDLFIFISGMGAGAVLLILISAILINRQVRKEHERGKEE